MTREIRTVIDLEDVIAVELECNNCRSIFTIPIIQYKNNIYKCPQCQHSWFPKIGGETDVAIHEMLAYMRVVVDKVKSTDAPLGMAMRFRIRGDGGPILASGHEVSGKG